MEKFFTWLSQQPPWVQVVTLAVMLGLIVYSVISILKRGFKFGKAELPPEEEVIDDLPPGVTVDRRKPSPHRSCIYSKDVVRVLTELPLLTVEKFTLMQYKGIRQMMNYAEQQAVIGMALLQKNYIELLKIKSQANVLAGYSYAIYRLLLRDLKRVLFDQLREIIIENSFTGLTDYDFDIYASARIKQLMFTSTDFLNEEYFYEVDVTREELYSHNKKILKELEAVFRDYFQKMRLIAEENKKEVAKIDEKIAQFGDYFA